MTISGKIDLAQRPPIGGDSWTPRDRLQPAVPGVTLSLKIGDEILSVRVDPKDGRILYAAKPESDWPKILEAVDGDVLQWVPFYSSNGSYFYVRIRGVSEYLKGQTK